MALTDEQKKKIKRREEERAAARKKAANAFKANPSSIPKKYQQSEVQKTTKKNSTVNNKTVKKNYSVGKNGSIKAKATKATKNYISGKSSNASGRKLTGTEKLRNSPGWNMTQEERFLKQRQYNRTKNDMSADKLDSKTWNAKDEAETRYTITGNYAKYAQQTARQAKENAEKYKKTGDAKYLDQAKEDANRARIFQQRMNSSVGNAVQAEKDFGFYLTSQKYDQYTRSTNPEYKAEAERRDAESRENFLKDRLNTARKNFALAELASFGRPGKDDKLEAARKELKAAQKAYDEVKGKSKDKADKAETAASETYTEMFKGLKAVTKPNSEQQAQLRTIQDEAERLAGLTETTETQQAEIQQFLKKYKTLPKVAQNQELINQMESKSGTATSRLSNITSSALNQYAADVLRVPGMVDDAASVVMDKLNIDDTPNTDRAKKAEEATALAIKWMDKAADKFEGKASENRKEAERGLGTIGKMGVDLGITLTQIGADAVNPIGATAGMATRVAGGAYNQVKESGADTDDALLNAGMHAAVEVLTERLFGLALPVYGRGSVDDLIEKAINKAAARVASKAGRRATKGFFRAVANFATEGGEELIAAGFDPIIDAVTVGDKTDMKRYGTQEFWDDAMYQMVLGGVAGFAGGSVNQIARGFEDVDEKTLKETQDKKAAKSFAPAEISDFSQSLINNGIKNKAAVNADTIISNLVDNEAEVTDKEINKMLDDLHITKKGAKTAGAQRNLTALKNRLGLTDLDSNISRADLVKAIREGARIAKQDKDMQTDADVRGMEEQAEAEQVRAEVDDAEQDISNAERSQQTITIGDETLTHDQYAERMQAVAEANGNVLTDEQINTLWDQAVSEFGTPVEEEAPQQIEGQMDLFGEMGRTDEEEAKFLEDTFGIKRGEDGQMNMFDAMDEDTIKEQVFGIKKQKDEMETLAEETQRKQNSVLEKNEAADKLAPETQEDLNTLAGNIGYRIEVHDHIPAPEGAADMENAIINGYIDKDNGTIHIAMDATDDIETTRSRILKVVAIHETTHGLETLAPEEYQSYSDYVENNWDVLNDGEDFATALENKMKQYADAGQDIGEIGARHELMAEFASHMDQDAIFDFVNSNPTIGQKIVDMFREIVSRLKETFGMAGDAETALRKWERAYQAAVKGTANVNNDTQVDEAYRAGVEVQDSDGEPVAIMSEDGQAQFSLRTYNEKGRDVLKRWLKRAQDEGLSEQDAKDIETEMEHIYEVCKEYADSNKYAPFGQWSNATVKKDKNNKPLLSVVTPNGEYKLNLDVALVCKKRQTLDKVFDRLVKRGVFDNFAMGQEDIANINQIIVKHKFETACAICFVESKRFRQAKIAEDFANQYNELVRSMMPEGAEATYFNFGGDPRLDEHNATVTNDVSQMDKSQLDFTRLNELDAELNDKGKKATRVDNKIARYLLKHPEGRHFVNRTDFIASSGFENVKAVSPDVLSLYNSKKGSGGPKSAFGFAQYMHEILSKSNFNAKAAYAVGGVRIQSFSDFVPRMFFDYAEIVGDLATKQLPAHAYTKEEAFVKLFGLTGIKINMSLVPASVEDGQAPGLDAEGNYAWEKGQTFDYNTAIEIQKAKGYGDNCGTIAVGVSDAHIRKMMADKNIRMIIPYHKSSLNPIIAAMNGISDFTDYTTYQNTRYADGTKLSDDDAKNEVNFNVFMHEQSMDPQQAAEAYVRWCEENDYLPKFDQFAYAQDKNGEYIVENGKLKVDENYYKLLEDFTLYNEPADPKAQRGSYVPQHEVKLRLPKDGDAFGSWQSLLTEDTYDEKGDLKYKGALKADTELDKKQNDEIDALVDDIIQNLNTPAVRERVSQEQIKARQERGDALRAAERQRYEEGLAKRKAAVQPARESSSVQYSLWKRVDPNQEQYKDWDSNSPRPVETIRPSSNSWTSGPSFADVKKRYPELFTEVPKKKNKANKKGHGSQSTSTENTYNSIFDRLEEENFDGTILDASSGQGLGTRDGKERGFSIEDVEPFPPDSEFHVPDYKDYNAINNTYDFIISNAVLNVEPQDQRDATIVRMGELLNDGGRMYINVRGISDVEGAKTKQPVDPANHEWYIPNSRSYQKGFTAQELKAYVEDALGDDYTVETAMNGFPKPSNAVTVMVYKGNSAPQYSLSFNKSIEDIDTSKPLKTKQGSTIKRAQNNVGKEIGGQIYVHKNYAADTKIPADVLARGEELVPDDFEYNSVMWDKSKPNEIRFDEAPDFDTATEPQVGHFLKINTETGNITAGYSPNIWHHKWLWVKDDYEGFDTREAYDRSQTWLSQVNGTAKGTIKSWNKQLEENGMEPIYSEPVPKDQAFLDRFNNKPKGIFPTKEEADRVNNKAEAPKVQFSISPTGKVEGFYSELQNTINGSKQHKMKPSQWLQYAKGHGQIKQEEIDYSGILSLPDESITKEDLLDYLRANQIELEEETLSSDSYGRGERDEDFMYEDTDDHYEMSFSDIMSQVNYWDKYTSYEAAMDMVEEEGYELPDQNPENYEFFHEFNRDEPEAATIYVHVYHKPTGEEWYVPRQEYVVNPKDDTKWSSYSTSGNTNYREILLKIPGSDYTNTAMSTHWEDRTGVLAHARVDDFTNAEGERVMFVEEIQSDWHNARNYAERRESLSSEIEKLSDGPMWRTEEAEVIWSYLNRALGTEKAATRFGQIMRNADDPEELGFYLDNVETETDVPVPANISPYVLQKVFHDLKPDVERTRVLMRKLHDIPEESAEVPDAPFKESYTSLTLKRLLSEAVEKGYDRLAWTSGEMQSERWDDRYAEGYHIEYDQQIPKFLSKYVKKWGSKVETTDLVSYETGEPAVTTKLREGEIGFWESDFEETPVVVQSIPITDAMRESISTKGQPQFSLGSPRTSNSVLGQNNTVPTEEEIKSGSATYGGLPIIYHPEMKADARNMDTEVWVSDKFFNDPDQQHILNHEVAHNLSDELMSLHTDDWQEFASNFIEEKQTPPSSSAYANGNRTYWEGLYGDIGATALSETTTRAITEYLDDPERLRQRSKDAYDVIDNFMRNRENNTQFSIGEKQNNQTNEVLRKMYESLGLSPNAQPMEMRPNARPKQSKVNANTYTNTEIYNLATEEIEDDELKTRAKNAGKRVKERGQYDRISEQESMATAKTRLENDYEGEKARLSDETLDWGSTDLDEAMGIASSELAKGNIEAFDEWTDRIQRMGTRAGQLIQAFAKYSRTPEGVAVQAKKALDELGKVKPEKKAELKETVNRLTKQLQAIQQGDLNALVDQFLEQAKIRNTKVNEKKVRREFANATWQRDYNRVVTQLLAIPTDYINASAGQKVATYQTLSHLLNLRTNNRNIISNFVFGEVETLANNIATIPDMLIGIGTGKRTVGAEGFGLAPKTLKAGLDRARQTALDVRADIMPLDSDTKYGTTRRTWKRASSNPLARGMSNLEMVLGYELNVTDEFAKGQHDSRIRKGLQKFVDKGMYSEEVMDQFAEQEMLYRTFQDDTYLGTILAGIKNHLNFVGVGHTGRYLKGNKYEIKEFGLGDLVQKYTTVPGALGTRVVEYSPVGYMKMFYNLAQLRAAQKNLKTEMAKEKPGDKRLASIETDLLNYQRALALSMSRATTGTGLVVGLYLLRGLIKSTPDSGDDDDDKNAAAIRTLQGLSGTQINMSALLRLINREDNAIDWRDGDTLYDLTFLEPMNGLMDISAQMVQDEDVESLRDEDFWKDLFGNSLESIYETFMDLPTMQQLNSIQMELRYHDDDMLKTIPTIGLELMKGSVSGFVPAPVRQFAQTQDDYYRETYQSTSPMDNIRDAFMNSVPGLRESLPTKQDSYGRDKEQEFLRRRALNAFVNPGKTSTYKVSPLEKEIADISSSTDNEYKLYPDRKAPKKLSFGDKQELSNDQKRKYMQILGSTYSSEMNDLIQSDDYQEASASEKEAMLLERRSFADKYAKTKLAEAFKTTYSSSSSVEKVLEHRDMGYSDKQWAELEKGMTGPKGSINQDAAKPYLDSITLDEDPAKDRQKKAEIWRAMGWQDYSKKGKKLNPYL